MARVGDITKQAKSQTLQESGPARRNEGELLEPVLLTLRMVNLFSIMRRSTLLSLRHFFKLSEMEWRIINHLARFAPLSLNGLVDLLLQDRGQISRTVKSMVEGGLVTRSRRPGGPEIEIGLTEAGHALYARMLERAGIRDKLLTEGLAEHEIATLAHAVEIMIGNAEALVEEAQSREAS